MDMEALLLKRIDSVEVFAQKTIDIIHEDFREHKKQVEHRINGFAHVVENVTATMIELETGHVSIQKQIGRIEDQIREHRDDIKDCIKELQKDIKPLVSDAVARKENTTSNLYLLKVIITLISSVFVAGVGAVLAFVLK